MAYYVLPGCGLKCHVEIFVRFSEINSFSKECIMLHYEVFESVSDVGSAYLSGT